MSKLWPILFCICLYPSQSWSIVKCFQKEKSVNLSHGGIVKKLVGEVICKRDNKIQRKIFFKKGIQIKNTFYDRDQKIKSEVNYNLNKKRHGKSIDYYPNGKIKREEVYEKGKKIGPNTMFFASGKLKKKEYFSDKSRSSFTYTEKGKLTSIHCNEKVAKFDDRRESKWCGFQGKGSDATLYNRKDQKFKIIRFHKGKTLKYTILNEKGIAIKTKDYGTIKHNNVEVSKYDDGTKKQEKRYDKDGYLSGIQKEFSKEGVLTREAFFKKGFMEYEKIYYLNKQLKIETQRRHQEKQIIADKFEFWDNGQKSFTGSYIEKKKDYNFGFARYYSYSRFKQIGDHKSWNDQGKLTSEEHYEDGKKDGKQKYFTEKGIPYLIQFFKKGDISRRIKFDTNGKKLSDDELHRDGSIKLNLLKSPTL